MLAGMAARTPIPPAYKGPLAFGMTPQLAAFFNDVAPNQSLLFSTDAKKPAEPPSRPSAVQPMPYSPHIHGADVSQLAELRIRQWVVQQELEARKQQQKRLFDPPKS